MKKFSIRTDLALEARACALPDSGELPGVRCIEQEQDGFPVTRVSVLDDRGASVLCKPIGEYITLELDKLIRREENAFADCAGVLAHIIKELLGNVSRVLVIGLGNDAITPDAIGPWTLESVLVTRHLKEHNIPEFASFASVSALSPGVLGTTGLEAAKIAKLLADEVQPEAVIVIDALASREMHRLCRTVQITDTGIIPGSGVGNARAEISKNTLGVPVIAIGVPTVVDAATIVIEMAENSGLDIDESALPQPGLIVTPRDIDRSARDAAKLVGYAINLALHEGLSVEDVDMLVN